LLVLSCCCSACCRCCINSCSCISLCNPSLNGECLNDIMLLLLLVTCINTCGCCIVYASRNSIPYFLSTCSSFCTASSVRHTLCPAFISCTILCYFVRELIVVLYLKYFLHFVIEIFRLCLCAFNWHSSHFIAYYI